jgi:2-amino-4-hydroxy-6-hydroxymethyldihydropteridine diphosphokinase
MYYKLFLSLGSNVEPKLEYLTKAIKELNRIFYLNRISSLYVTDPIDDIDQDEFINLSVSYNSNINDPYKILKIVKTIEKKIGRVKDKNRPKGPRQIDIDIIFFEDIELNSTNLIIPHKRLFKRKFVLEPLIEILPENSIYLKKYNLRSHLKKVEKQNTKKIGVLEI